MGVADLFDVIVGYPEGIGIEYAVVQVALLETVGGVDDGFGLIVFFYFLKPGENFVLEGRQGFVASLFDVEYRRQVAGGEGYVLDEKGGLASGRCLWVVEMVGSAGESFLFGLGEIGVEPSVEQVASFGGLDEYEPDGGWFSCDWVRTSQLMSPWWWEMSSPCMV